MRILFSEHYYDKRINTRKEHFMSYESDLSFNFVAPTKVVFGEGSLSELPMEITALGKSAVLVTDAGIAATGLVDAAKKAMGNLLKGIYADIPQDSGMEVVDKGAALALSIGCRRGCQPGWRQRHRYGQGHVHSHERRWKHA